MHDASGTDRIQTTGARDTQCAQGNNMTASTARRRIGVLAYTLRAREYARRIFRAAGYSPLVFVSIDELIEFGADASELDMLLIGDASSTDSLGRTVLESVRGLVGPNVPLLHARLAAETGPLVPHVDVATVSPRYFGDLCAVILAQLSIAGIDKAPVQMTWGDYTFVPAGRVVVFGGRQVRLDPVAFDIALELFFRAGQLVSKKTLIQMLPANAQGPERHRIDNVGSVIKELRSSLRLRALHGWTLETHPHLGYRLVRTMNRGQHVSPPAAAHRQSTQVFSPAP